MSASQRNKLKQIALSTPSGFLAFGFGSGLAPKAPGTFGTLAAIPFAWVIKTLPLMYYLPLLLLLFLLGVWICGRVGREIGQHDHGGIVWDEMVGYWLAIAFVPMQWSWLIAAFVLFRLFDIWKPWPIRYFDKKMGGGFGVMVDDVLAAVYTILVLWLADYLIASL